MKYPKKVMSLTELTRVDNSNPDYNIGYSREWLLMIYQLPGQQIAWKIGKGGKTSPIVFDTDELEKYRRACCPGGKEKKWKI
jgi:hypothetical protein